MFQAWNLDFTNEEDENDEITSHKYYPTSGNLYNVLVFKLKNFRQVIHYKVKTYYSN
jgi:hypothetical protein